jgi:hypothetical protein
MKRKSIAIIGSPDIVEESGMHDVKTYTYKNAIIDMPKIMEVEPIKSPKEFGQQKLGINKRRKRR